ncbi:MAG TPA: protein phosphatase 2C domain-containing protein, partial [Micromonosporaceae bacterium]|nr:protein phosphatase 2C domain-containing protein [Micromonosporaceae bacterium]
MPSILRTVVLTDLGLRRGNNEDCAYAGRRVLAVADGMGGLPAGELASDLAVAALKELDEGTLVAPGEPGNDEPAVDEPADGEPAADEDPLVGELRAAFDVASGRIRVAAAQDGEQRYGMGTTVTAVLFGRADDGSAGDESAGLDRAVLMHVGDSRGYLFRDGVLTQLTKDDTYVQALVDQGVLTPDGARRHPQRSLVTQAMQGQ